MTTPSLFSWFDRAILGAIFVGLVLVGLGVIHALNAAIQSIDISREGVEATEKNSNATYQNTKIALQNQKLILQILVGIENVTADNPQTTLEEQKESFRMTEEILAILNSSNTTGANGR